MGFLTIAIWMVYHLIGLKLTCEDHCHINVALAQTKWHMPELSKKVSAWQPVPPPGPIEILLNLGQERFSSYGIIQIYSIQKSGIAFDIFNYKLIIAHGLVGNERMKE